MFSGKLSCSFKDLNEPKDFVEYYFNEYMTSKKRNQTTTPHNQQHKVCECVCMCVCMRKKHVSTKNISLSYTDKTKQMPNTEVEKTL